MTTSNSAFEQMKRDFRKSEKGIQKMFRDHDMYKQNYDYLLHSPLYQDMLMHNRLLKNEKDIMHQRIEDMSIENITLKEKVYELEKWLKTYRKSEKKLLKQIVSLTTLNTCNKKNAKNYYELQIIRLKNIPIQNVNWKNPHHLYQNENNIIKKILYIS